MHMQAKRSHTAQTHGRAIPILNIFMIVEVPLALLFPQKNGANSLGNVISSSQ